MYELIVAMDTDGNIGVTDAMGRQKMPWERTTHKSKAMKEDMRYFREKTMNHILIMGRKTFESLPKRPLPGRIHVVLTNTPAKYETEYENNNSVFFIQLEHLDNLIKSLLDSWSIIHGAHSVNYPENRVFVCGGEEIYRILLPKCERLHITCVMDTYSSILCENETYTKFPTEEDWLSFYKEVDLVAFAFDDDSSLVRRTYVKK